MRFELRWFDASTARVASTLVDAVDEASARAALPAEVGRVQVLSVRRMGHATDTSTYVDVAWWCQELRTLVDAGMTVVEALETMQRSTTGAGGAALTGRLVAALARGQALSAAMAQEPDLPALLVAGVRAGERSGGLATALDDYQRFHAMTDAMRQRALSAAIYPALVLVLGVVIGVVLLVWVVPRFAAMYAGTAAELSLPTKALLALSSVLSGNGPWMGLALACGLLGGAWAWRTRRVHRWAGELGERIGPVRRRLDQFRLAQLYRSLALLLRGGYVLDEAVRLCEPLPLGGRLQAGLRSAGQAMRTGQRVSVAFGQAGLTELVTQRLLAVGERSGQFERVLQVIADRHAQRFETMLERLSRVVEPLMLLAVALGIGALVLLLYMPIFDLASGVA